MTDDGVEELNREQLDRLASYVDEEVIAAQNYESPGVEVQRFATG